MSGFIVDLLDFMDIAVGAASIAKVNFYIFLVLLLILLFFGGMIRKKVSDQ